MNIGDTVLTKKIGSPVMGKLVAIMDREFYTALTGQTAGLLIWDEHYSDWRDKPMVVVQLSESTTIISYERMQEMARERFGPDAFLEREVYDSVVNEHKFLTFPIDDIELL